MTEEGEAMTFLANGLYTTASLQFLLALSGACYTWIGYARDITNLESVHLHSTNLVDAEEAIPFVANLCRGNGSGLGNGTGLGTGLGLGHRHRHRHRHRHGNGHRNDLGHRHGNGHRNGNGNGSGLGHGHGLGNGHGIGIGIGDGSGCSGCGNGTARGTDVEIFIETLGWVGHVEAKQALVKLYEDLTRV